MNSNRQRYDHELLGSSFAHNAEQAAVPVPDNTPKPIVTPCHGAELWVTVSPEGEVDSIYCEHTDCLNQWNPDGTVEHWMPDQA